MTTGSASTLIDILTETRDELKLTRAKLENLREAVRRVVFLLSHGPCHQGHRGHVVELEAAVSNTIG